MPKDIKMAGCWADHSLIDKATSLYSKSNANDKIKDSLREILANIEGTHGKSNVIFKNVLAEEEIIKYADKLKELTTSNLKSKDISKEIEKTSPVDVPLEKYASLAFAKCCCPLYGDDIVGVVSKNGVTIHTANCLNLKGLEADKVVDATWREGVDRLFDVNLRIVAKDTIGLAAKIFKIISEEKFDMSRISAREINSTEAEFEICVGVKNNKELDTYMKRSMAAVSPCDYSKTLEIDLDFIRYSHLMSTFLSHWIKYFWQAFFMSLVFALFYAITGVGKGSNMNFKSFFAISIYAGFPAMLISVLFEAFKLPFISFSTAFSFGWLIYLLVILNLLVRADMEKN
jgi:hypothetical protein